MSGPLPPLLSGASGAAGTSGADDAAGAAGAAGASDAAGTAGVAGASEAADAAGAAGSAAAGAANLSTPPTPSNTASARPGDDAEGGIELAFGPRHPALHGVLRLRLTLEDEAILDCRPLVGFGHRGLEKMFEAHPLRDGVALTDRLDFVAAAAANLAYAGAVEELLGLTVPPRARMLRVALGELQRVASHLFWLAGHAAEAGADGRRLGCLRDRERVLDLLEAACGARLTLRCAAPGGLPRDVPADWPERCGELAAALPGWVDGYEELLTGHRGFRGRTIGLGVLAPETALDHGVSGPVLRASGIDFDLRKALPYDGYEELDFDVPTGRNGDAYDRYRVRVAELRQSARLIAQAMDRLPGGPVLATAAAASPPAGGTHAADGAGGAETGGADGAVAAAAPAGLAAGAAGSAAAPPAEERPAGGAATGKAPQRESYYAVEGPRGEIGFYLAQRAGGLESPPWRCHVRAPSFHNLQVLPEIARGHGVGDLVVLLGSLDLALGEVDR